MSLHVRATRFESIRFKANDARRRQRPTAHTSRLSGPGLSGVSRGARVRREPSGPSGSRCGARTQSYQFSSALGRRASSYGLCVRRSTTDPPAISRLGSASDRRDDPSPDRSLRRPGAPPFVARPRPPRVSDPQGEPFRDGGYDGPAGRRASRGAPPGRDPGRRTRAGRRWRCGRAAHLPGLPGWSIENYCNPIIETARDQSDRTAALRRQNSAVSIAPL